MLSLKFWSVEWWKQQFTEISFWAALYGLATPSYSVVDTLFWIFIIGLDDESIREFLRSKIAPTLGKGVEHVATAAREAREEMQS